MLSTISYLGKHDTPRFSFFLIKTIPSTFSGDSIALFGLIISDSIEKTRFSTAKFGMLIMLRKTLTQTRRCNTEKNFNQLCVSTSAWQLIHGLYASTLLRQKINGHF